MVKKVEKLNKNYKKKTTKKTETKTILIGVSAPLWIMKILFNSSISIPLFPKNIRRRINYDSGMQLEYCFLSILKILIGLNLIKYSNFLKRGLSIKSTKILLFLTHPDIKKCKIDNLLKKKCIYERNLYEKIILSYYKILKWKKCYLI
jgi:hypothetical protein